MPKNTDAEDSKIFPSIQNYKHILHHKSPLMCLNSYHHYLFSILPFKMKFTYIQCSLFLSMYLFAHALNGKVSFLAIQSPIEKFPSHHSR